MWDARFSFSGSTKRSAALHSSMQSDTSAKSTPALWHRAHYNCHFDCPWPFSLYPLPHEDLLNISFHTKPFVLEAVNAESHGDDTCNMQINMVFYFLDNTQYPIAKWHPGQEIQFLQQELSATRSTVNPCSADAVAVPEGCLALVKSSWARASCSMLRFISQAIKEQERLPIIPSNMVVLLALHSNDTWAVLGSCSLADHLD